MARVDVRSGRLIVTQPLIGEHDPVFADACNSLLRSHEKELIIDFANCSYISDTNLSLIIITYYQARELGKVLYLVAEPSVLEQFCVYGFSSFIRMEVRSESSE